MTKEELEKMEKLREERDSLKKSYDRYFQVSSELQKLSEKQAQEEKRSKYYSIARKCRYVEAENPRMGSPGENGFAFFESKADADDFIEALRKFNDWYGQGYVLEWSGPGEYTVEPSYKYDCDGDVVYTATFKKDEEYGKS